jgi:hypothetical protein
MEECLAIKPDLIFLWDEAWFGFARFNPLHRRRTAMGAAAALTERYRDPPTGAEYEASRQSRQARPEDPKLLDMHLLPDPDKVRIRVYQTNSTHKSMSALPPGLDDAGVGRGLPPGGGKPSRRPSSPTPRPRPTCSSSPRWTSRAGRWSWKATGDACA